jgi:hypothetical protein
LRIRTIQELGEAYKTPDLLADITKRSLQWLGHVNTMDKERERTRIL